MFVDYYVILDIDEESTLEQIKLAFKRQALKWHPDRNPSRDTTKQMQEINEAYLILKDDEARERYNLEYQKFKKHRKQEQSNQYQNEKANAKEKTYEYSNYKVDDEILNNWMNNARNQAVALAKQTIEDFKGMVSIGVKEAAKGAGNQFVAQIAVSIIFIIIFALAKSCNN